MAEQAQEARRLAAEARRLTNQAVTEGVNLKYVERIRQMIYTLVQQLEQAEQRIAELERALKMAIPCVGNYAVDSPLGEALAAAGRSPGSGGHKQTYPRNCCQGGQQ